MKSLTGMHLLSSEVSPEISEEFTTKENDKGRSPRFARDDEKRDFKQKNRFNSGYFC